MYINQEQEKKAITQKTRSHRDGAADVKAEWNIRKECEQEREEIRRKKNNTEWFF